MCHMSFIMSHVSLNWLYVNVKVFLLAIVEKNRKHLLQVINRPGIAGAVLQTPLLLIK